MRVAVLGATGQLGAAVRLEFAAAHEVVPLGRGQLDITDDAAVREALAAIRPDVIVNCAAYNRVDQAEDQPVEALRVNALAVRTLAAVAGEIGAILVHYSTDFVFDGEASTPYSEDDPPNPRSVYAASKLLGEWFALDSDRAYVLRVESLFGMADAESPHKGSVAGIVARLSAGEDARVFSDRTISPLYVIDGARATRQLVEDRAPFGLYHCVNSGECSWVELARALADRLHAGGSIVPIRMSDMDLRASRPKYCVLSNLKLASIGIAMPTWHDALERYLDRLNGAPSISARSRDPAPAPRWPDRT
jgi:dTDP-4-dehydrorhamnose reductase